MSGMTRAELAVLPAIFDRAVAADALGCSEWTVRQMQVRGELATVRLGRLARVRLVDVLQLLGLTPDMATAEPASSTAALTDQVPGGPSNGQRKHLRPA